MTWSNHAMLNLSAFNSKIMVKIKLPSELIEPYTDM